jgi:CheY-like chemotaxis protein
MTVTDTGCGMTKDVLARAVEPFFTTKEIGKGTGLGLSGAYGFARQSGGFLLIDSKVDQGTTVSVYLPRATAGAGTEGRERPSASDDIPMGDGELVIVVEDDAKVREVTLNRMEGLGYSVLPAKTGAEAIELLKSGEPAALVLSDVVMPGGLSGYDVASWVRRERPEVKILLTSGFSERMRQDDEAIRRLTVLSKPYSRAQLGVAVRAALAG